jgi:hypothetical protein
VLVTVLAVVALVALLPFGASAFTSAQAQGAGGSPFRLIAPRVVFQAGPRGTIPPTAQSATIPEQAMANQLAAKALPSVRRANSYPAKYFEELSSAGSGDAVLLRGRVWHVLNTGQRVVLTVDMSGNAIDSKPVLVVVPGNLVAQPDPTLEVEVRGVYVDKTPAADRFGANQDTPVVEAHVLSQASQVLFSAY